MRESGLAGKLCCSVGVVFFCISVMVAGPPTSKAEVERYLESGQLAYRLTEPSEVTAVFGEPEKTDEFRDGEMTIRLLRYSDTIFAFGRRSGTQAPFALVGIAIQGQQIDIGENRKVVFRTKKDFDKLEPFNGFQNVSLARLDLRDDRDLLERMSFDSRTEWPSADKLPPDFDPQARLHSGLYPGLGLRELHQKGIDGRGVGIAIIDQPLLRDHREYRDALAAYESIGVDGVAPQMHGPAVASIAVGKNRGVAPGSRLTFFAIPMWKPENQPYIDAMKKILEINRTRPDAEKIRVVSISTGMFPQQAHYEEWLSALKEVEASGVFVVTCDPSDFAYGTLIRVAGQDPDDPGSYRSGRYRMSTGAVLVPAGNMTRASYAGPETYAFDPEGGMSWAAPYIAGLAALAYQVKPSISPSEIRGALTSTATTTNAGRVANPRGFIAEIAKETPK